MTMILLETVVLGSAAASITFSSIPGTFTDLLVVYSLRDNYTSPFNGIDLLINGSSANLSGRRLSGSGSAASSETLTYEALAGLTNSSGSTANVFSNGQIYIPNYRANVAKSISIDCVAENNATATSMAIIAGLFNSTNPITSIDISPNGPQLFQQYSSASLFGVLAGSDGIVAVS